MGPSYAEKSVWILLAALAAGFTWYSLAHIDALVAGSLGFDDMLGGLIALVILITVVEVAYHVVLGIESARDGVDSSMLTDERDSLIATRSERFASFVLSVGAVAGIFSAAFLSPILTAHVLLAALVLAECIKLVAQLVYYRQGV